MKTQPKRRRQYASGAVFQACSATAGCPELIDGPVNEKTGKPARVRPKHRCKGRWLGTFEVGNTRSGGRRRKTVTGKTEAEVKEKLRVKMKELSRDDDAETDQHKTVKTWAAEWLEISVLKVRPNTHTTDIAASKWIVETLGHRLIEQVSPRNVRALSLAIEASGLSSSTARRYHGTFIRMLKAAAKEGLPVNPAVFVVGSPEEAVNDRLDIPLPDCLALLQVVATLPHGSRWLFALLQGPRQAEALGLTWDQLGEDLAKVVYEWQLQPLPYRTIRDRTSGFRVPRGYEARQLVGRMHLVRPKSKAGWRTAPLDEVLTKALKTWQAMAWESPHGLVWPALNGNPADEQEDREEWHAIQGTAMVGHPAGRYYTVHEARHATATLLRALGASEQARKAMMGHSSINSTRAYEHGDLMPEMREVGKGMAALLQLDLASDGEG